MYTTGKQNKCRFWKPFVCHFPRSYIWKLNNSFYEYVHTDVSGHSHVRIQWKKYQWKCIDLLKLRLNSIRVNVLGTLRIFRDKTRFTVPSVLEWSSIDIIGFWPSSVKGSGLEQCVRRRARTFIYNRIGRAGAFCNVNFYKRKLIIQTITNENVFSKVNVIRRHLCGYSDT